MGFIVMFDITNEQSFMSIRPWLDQLRLHSYCENPDVVLCGNKADLEDRRAVSWTKAKNEANKYGIPYVETSAATGQNVSQAIEALLDLVMVRMHKVVESNIPKLIDNTNNHGIKLDSSNLIGGIASNKNFTQDTSSSSSCSC